MKITKTQLITDENDVAVGINLDIEINKGDAATPMCALLELQNWYDVTGSKNKELATKGVGGISIIWSPQNCKHTIQISIWNQYRPTESQSFRDVAFKLSDGIWKEAILLYGKN